MRYASFSEAWRNELALTARDGRRSSPRGMGTVERRWAQFEVDDPLTFPVQAEGRKFADVIGVLEALSLVGQFSVPETFTDRIAKFREFTDAGVFHGSYGARVAGRLGDLVELLKRDPDTRQAVLSIYDSRSDLGAAKRDIPCTLSLHFMRYGELLDMRVTMRSNDMWLGTPYDFTQFAVLQATIAQAIGAYPGAYVHSVGSLHIYDRDLPRLDDLRMQRVPRRPFAFPLWAVSDIAEISERARRLALLDQDLEPLTEFESWARDLLLG